MYLVADNITEVFSKPIAFCRDSLSARYYLKAPAIVQTILLSDKDICKQPYVCDTYDDALKISGKAIEILKEIRQNTPSTYDTCYNYEPKIIAKTSGSYRVTLDVYIVDRYLPIGRNLDEALNDPLGRLRPHEQKDPTFEDIPLKPASGRLRGRYKSEKSLISRYGVEIRQSFIEIEKVGEKFCGRLKFMKAPKVTFERDRLRLKQGMSKPLYHDPLRARSLKGHEMRDLFNRDVVLVTDEGDGRSF